MSTDARVEALERRLSELEAARRPRRMRSVVVAAALLSIAITGVATAVNGAPFILGAGNNQATNETGLVSSATTYGLRVNNTRGGDGGALAGICRGTAATEACVGAASFGSGRALDVLAGSGEAMRITTTDPSAKPLTTNATGVATGFNADKVDGKNASELGNVLGYGVKRRDCVSNTHCPLDYNRGVNSVRKGAIGHGQLCVAVEGASPQDGHIVIAGLDGYYGNASWVNTQNHPVGDPNHRCEPYEFQIESGSGLSGGSTELNLWFAVLR